MCDAGGIFYTGRPQKKMHGVSFMLLEVYAQLTATGAYAWHSGASRTSLVIAGGQGGDGGYGGGADIALLMPVLLLVK